MKVTNLTIQSFQGIDYLDLNINKTRPITLLAGKNATGKTSIRDAIRFALIGDSDRVALKKDYPAMVRKGANAKEAFTSVTADGFTWKRNIASGQSDTDLPDYPMVLPYLMGHTRFAMLPSREKMPILFNITGTSAKPAAIVEMLREMKIEEFCITGVTPILRLGFAKAHKHCKDQQTQARGAWKAITGETFGASKAANWTAPEVEYDIEDLENQASNITGNVEAAKEEFDAASDAYDEAMKETDKRNKNVSVVARAERDTEIRATVYTCPCCEENLTMTADGLIPYVKPKVTKKKASKKKAAKKKELPPIDLMGLHQEMTTLNREYASMQQQLSGLNAELSKAQGAAAEQADKEQRARNYFNDFNNWDAAAKALDDDGIPLRILKTALKPVNDRLYNTSKVTGWPEMKIQRDLSIVYNDTPYGLCSESEQWRIDAAIAEAISILSGVGMFVLDRMDVLHPEERIKLIQWLLNIKGKHDSIFILATLKTPPGGMPEAINTYWLTEGGELEKVK